MKIDEAGELQKDEESFQQIVMGVGPQLWLIATSC